MRDVPMRAVNQLAEQESRYVLTSPLLFGSLQSLDPGKRIEVLDLSPANTQLLEYFSQYHCKLYLPGCRADLLEIAKADTEKFDSLSTRVLSDNLAILERNNATLDVILLWDLVDYLDRRLLTKLINSLFPYTNSNTVLHSYIHTRQKIPAQPADYRIALDNRVICETSVSWPVSSPMYYQELLHKVLTPFRVDKGMLLANGQQEYILRVK